MYINSKYKIFFALAAKLTRKSRQRFALYLFIKLIQINFIFADCIHILYISLWKNELLSVLFKLMLLLYKETII